MKPALTWTIAASGLLLLSGAMAWATWSLVGMERTRHRMEADAVVQERTRLALWRMESVAASLVLEESARAPEQYTPPPAGSAAVFPADPSGRIQLHFEMDPDGRLHSPQVPEGPEKPAVPDESARLLQELRGRLAEKASPGQWASLGMDVRQIDRSAVSDNKAWLSYANNDSMSGDSPSLGSNLSPVILERARRPASSPPPPSRDGLRSEEKSQTADALPAAAPPEGRAEENQLALQQQQQQQYTPAQLPSALKPADLQRGQELYNKIEAETRRRVFSDAGKSIAQNRAPLPPEAPELAAQTKDEALSKQKEDSKSGGTSKAEKPEPQTKALPALAAAKTNSPKKASREKPAADSEDTAESKSTALPTATGTVPSSPIAAASTTAETAAVPDDTAAGIRGFGRGLKPETKPNTAVQDSPSGAPTLADASIAPQPAPSVRAAQEPASGVPNAPQASTIAQTASNAGTVPQVLPPPPSPSTAAAVAVAGVATTPTPEIAAATPPPYPSGDIVANTPAAESSVHGGQLTRGQPLNLDASNPGSTSPGPASTKEFDVSPPNTAPVTPSDSGSEAVASTATSDFASDSRLDQTGTEALLRLREGTDSAATRSFGFNRLSVGPAASGSAVTVSDFRALWIKDALLLTRRISRGGAVSIQGAWVDWPKLRANLLGTVSDLFPSPSLEPVPALSGGGTASGTDLLASLPIRFVPGPLALPAPPFWSPLKLSLATAWACVLLATGAVVLVLRGMMLLSDRRASFVSAVTHELRTPLATFKLYSEMLADGMVKEESKRQRYLETLTTEADRLGHLVENVLSYSRLESGKVPAGRAPVEVRDLLQRLAPRLSQRAEQAGAEWEISAATLPDNLSLTTDPAAVEQILFNLVDNACKYARRDGAAARVELDVRIHKNRALFAVRDYGPGISRAESKKLFRPFHKSARDAAHSAPGVGLGLALCRRLARDLGGTLEPDHTWPHGACFVLRLPC